MSDFLAFFVLAIPLVGAYTMYAVGIVVIHQASRVLNLAHGVMAAVPALLTFSLATGAGLPVVPSVVLGVAGGALLGVGVERLLVRRLRRVSATAQTVGTVAALGVCVAVSGKIWARPGLRAPDVFPEGIRTIAGVQVLNGQIGLFAVAVVATAGLFALFRWTEFGLAMKGAAQNRRAASLMGINPDATTTVAWAMGGALAGLTGILLAPVTTLNPYVLPLTVLPAYVAALIGGLESLPGALYGSATVGLVMGLVPFLARFSVFRPVLGQLGGQELAMAATAMVVMALRGQRFASSDVRAEVL